MVQSPYENLPFQSYHSNLKNVALEYKRLLKIKITDSSLLRDILENPYYPSLLSLSDTFKKYSIKNVAYRISGEYLDEMEVPFIGLMNLDSIGSDFILVKKITKNTVTYFYNKKRTETIERNEFLKRFENIALVFLGEEKNGEERDSYNFRKENTSKSRIAILTGSVAIIISFLIAINFTTNNALPFVLISIFKLLGLSAIIFLLLYEFNRNNKLARNICGLSSETNCDAVLSSRGAKILGISWSEIGLFYFVSTGLVLFVSGFAFTTKIG